MTSESTEFWDERFGEQGAIWGDEPSIAAIEAAGRLAPGRLLDVGCGYGRDVTYFAEKSFDACGVDFSKPAIDLGRTLHPGLELLVGSAHDLPYEDAAFDVAFANYLLHLFLEPDERAGLLRELNRVVVPGGRVVLSVASTADVDYVPGSGEDDVARVGHTGVEKLFYSRERIAEEFAAFDEVDVVEIAESHVHDKPHTHASWLILASKKRGSGNGAL